MGTRYPTGRLRHLPDGTSPRDKAILAWINARVYLRYPRTVLKHRDRVGTWPSIGFPHNLNEMIFWRKAFDRNPLFAELSDKLNMKKFYQERCPGISVPKTLWVGDRAEDIPDDLLNGSVIVKTTGASAQNILVRSGSHHRAELNATLNRWLSGPNYGKVRYEWAYLGVKSRIMVEELIEDEDGTLPINVKVFMANGRPLLIFVSRFASNPSCMSDLKQAGSFRPDGTRIWAQDAAYPHANQVLPADYELPPTYQDALRYSRLAGQGFDYVRLDFLCDRTSIYAGEVTIYSGGGFDTWNTLEVPRIILDNWDLRRSWFLRSEQTGWRAIYAASLKSTLDRYYAQKSTS